MRVGPGYLWEEYFEKRKDKFFSHRFTQMKHR
jgi:hypothetical protein